MYRNLFWAKKFVGILLVVIMIFTLMPLVVYAKDYSSIPAIDVTLPTEIKNLKNSTKQNEKIVGVAAGYLGKSPTGIGECAEFIMVTCRNAAGISSQILPGYTSCSKAFTAGYKKTAFQNSVTHLNTGKSGYTPKVGDLIFFDWDRTAYITENEAKKATLIDSDHVGLVAKVDILGNVYILHGNYGSSSNGGPKVRYSRCNINKAQVIGFISPGYAQPSAIESLFFRITSAVADKYSGTTSDKYNYTVTTSTPASRVEFNFNGNDKTFYLNADGTNNFDVGSASVSADKKTWKWNNDKLKAGKRTITVTAYGVSSNVSEKKYFQIDVADPSPNPLPSDSFEEIAIATITANAGIGGTVSGGGRYTYGTQVTLTAAASVGYSFDAWYENNKKIEGAGAIYTFTATSSRTLEARFFYTVSQPYTIAAAAGAGGSISPSGAVSIAAGASKTFTITPSGGYNISNVTVDGVSVGAIASYTFENVIGSHEIYAEFKIAPQLDTVRKNAYINGYDDDLIKPEAQITREEVAAIFYRLLTEESRGLFEVAGNSFSDVDTSRWSNKAISTLTNAGILKGYEDGTFRPANPITRAELVKVVAGFVGASDEISGNPFSDISSHWAREHILYAVNNGWVSGYEDGSFRPDRFITRAEAIKIVNSVLGRKDSDIDRIEFMKKWRDNSNENTWYYKAVQVATNTYI